MCQSYNKSYQNDPDYLQKGLESNLDKFAQAKLRLIGRRFILAQMTQQQELAAYLKQAASEEIRQINQNFYLPWSSTEFQTTIIESYWPR